MIEKVSSKNLLAESLLQLSKAKPLSKITVMEIARNCSLSREAFYYYFSDKYQLIFWIYKTHVDQFVVEGRFQEKIIDIWANSLTVLQKYDYFYIQAIKDPLIIEQLRTFFVEDVTTCVAHYNQEQLKDDDIRFAIDFYANGLLQVTLDWLKSAERIDAYTSSKRMCAIMPQVLKNFYIF